MRWSPASRLLVGAVALIGLLGGAHPSASAQEAPEDGQPDPCAGPDSSTVACGGSEEHAPSDLGGGAGGGTRPDPNSGIWGVALSADQNGQACYILTRDAGGPTVTANQAVAASTLDDEYPGCPGGPASAPRIGDIWNEEAGLPSPLVSVEPANRSLAGKRVYLEIGLAEDGDFKVAPDGGITYEGERVEIRATPEYEVTWDAERPDDTTRSTSQGIPYPGGAGEIVHTYEAAGVYEVSVSARWSAEWRLRGAQVDELPGAGMADGAWTTLDAELLTVGSTDVTVQQVQALRLR